MAFKVPERYRVKQGAIASDAGYGNNGAFVVALKRGQTLFVIASDMMGWEHVSVSRADCGAKHGNRTPGVATWHEGTCGICGEKKPVTEPRDYGHLKREWK